MDFDTPKIHRDKPEENRSTLDEDEKKLKRASSETEFYKLKSVRSIQTFEQIHLDYDFNYKGYSQFESVLNIADKDL